MQDNLIGKIQKLIHRIELLQVQTGTKILFRQPDDTLYKREV